MTSGRIHLSLRAAMGRTARLVAVLAIVLADSENAVAAEPTRFRLVQTDNVRLLQYEAGSELPVFRVMTVIDNSEGVTVDVSSATLIEAIAQRVEIYDGKTRLKTYCLRTGGEVLEWSKRYAILLLDHSWSMADAIEDGRSKFDAAKDACRRFADNFVDNVDHVAVVPFSDERVIGDVKKAAFLPTKAEFLGRIEGLSEPGGTTPLYGAMFAALSQLKMMRRASRTQKSLEPDCFLLALTDGMNTMDIDMGTSFGPATDPNDTLIDEWQDVRRLADELGIQTVIVGFGKSDDLNEDVLRQLAWPTADSYAHARDASNLAVQFNRARRYQLQQLQLHFVPREDDRSKLVRPKRFTIRLKLNEQGEYAEGQFTWIPPGLWPPPWEGTVDKKVHGELPLQGGSSRPFFTVYVATLSFYIMAFLLLWFKVPRWIWARQFDADILLRQAKDLQKALQPHHPNI